MLTKKLIKDKIKSKRLKPEKIKVAYPKQYKK